jgi:hypothetical protein
MSPPPGDASCKISGTGEREKIEQMLANKLATSIIHVMALLVVISGAIAP